MEIAAILSTVLDLSVVVFAIASMLSVGFSYTVEEILGPLRNVGGVVRSLIANFVMVPLLTLLVLRLLPLEEPLAIGLFLIGVAAGAPFLIKLTEAACGDVALSATLLVVLVPATIVYMPIVIPLALPEAEVSAPSIATPLVLTMLLPLFVGLFVRARSLRWAERLQPAMAVASSAALVVLILVTILVNLTGIIEIFLSPAIIAALVVIGGAFVIGYLLGGEDRDEREVLGLGTSQRNIAAATVVATQTIGHPDTVVMVIVSSLVGFAILFPLAAQMRKQSKKRAAAAKESPEEAVDER